MSIESFADDVWYGQGVWPTAVRSALGPASWMFGLAVARRNARFDAHVPRALALPALSIGNLTVGGTGKTPVAAWCVRQLRARAASPAIVMRGVGDDEWRVHGVLNRGVPVVVSPDRANGAVVARTRGADCVVLDDAFQHRQAARVADVVLVSADRWDGHVRLLPSGPFREPLSALRRAHAIVITSKAVDPARRDAVRMAVTAAAPDVAVVEMRFVLGEVCLAAALLADGGRPASAAEGAQRGAPRGAPQINHPSSWLAGRSVVLASAIGDPASFERQVRDAGAEVHRTHRFADHHKFSSTEVIHIASSAASTAGVVCTLKDAVKLMPLWPREAPPLWYLSQSVVVDRGAEAMDRVLTRVLSARAATAPTAG